MKWFKIVKELRNKLYSLDKETIQGLGVKSQKGIDPKDVLSSNIEELYTKAKTLIEWQELYKDLCEECAKDREDEENVK